MRANSVAFKKKKVNISTVLMHESLWSKYKSYESMCMVSFPITANSASLCCFAIMHESQALGDLSRDMSPSLRRQLGLVGRRLV